MASRNAQMLSQSVSVPPFQPTAPHPRGPLAPGVSFGRSTLRSAEEQLRDIRQGDTSWQRNHSPLLYGSPSSRPSLSPGSMDRLDNEADRLSTKPQIRVYLHHVRKTDTMPLILLAYEISASVLKRANRLWDADSIQSREKLYLPVAECGVKPVPCSAPAKTNKKVPNGIYTDIYKRSELEGENVDWPPWLQTPLPPAEYDSAGEWVSIPGIGSIQIVSLPAQELSHFPTPKKTAMERSISLPGLDALVSQDKAPRDSMDSVVSRSSIRSLIEDRVGRIVRFWQDNQGRKKWAKTGRDSIEL